MSYGRVYSAVFLIHSQQVGFTLVWFSSSILILMYKSEKRSWKCRRITNFRIIKPNYLVVWLRRGENSSKKISRRISHCYEISRIICNRRRRQDTRSFLHLPTELTEVRDFWRENKMDTNSNWCHIKRTFRKDDFQKESKQPEKLSCISNLTKLGQLTRNIA